MIEFFAQFLDKTAEFRYNKGKGNYCKIMEKRRAYAGN